MWNCRLSRPTGRRMASRIVTFALLLLAGTAQAAMYRWVDGAGRVHYGDTLPPTYQQSGAAEMDKQGNVVKRTQSQAERTAEAERRAEALRQQQTQQKQAQLDRALTQTYTSEAEIDLARDRALEHHKLAINGAELRSKAVAANLAELRARITKIQQAGRKVGTNLMAQLEQASHESDELKRTIQSNEEAMTQVREKYEADKQRFRELTAKK